MNDMKELAERSLNDACASLLPSPREAAGAESPLRFAAIIGFAGDHLRGTLALTACEGSVARVCADAGQDAAVAEDALGELTNLLAGHVKRSFARFGQVVEITPPIVVRGVSIEVCPQGASKRVEVQHSDVTGRMVAWMDYDAADDLVLEEDADSESVTEGEGLFF